MSRKPRLLDLFSGAGGAAMGYHRAGFEVVGVDIRPQPNYPFEFHQADAMTYPLDGFDAIHASPPCQAYSAHVTSTDSPNSPSRGKNEPALIADTRARMAAAGVPFVIENVYGARRELSAGLLLCGGMFDLPVRRHRLFESSDLLMAPAHDCRAAIRARERFPLPSAWGSTEPSRLGKFHRAYTVTGKSRGAGCVDFWRELMDMPWAGTAYELTEAIPPAYTEWIGRQLLNVVEVAA
jgi:hypothetical protein